MKCLIFVLSLVLLAGCQTTGEYVDSRSSLDENQYTVNQRSDIFILYIGAGDCPPCGRFKAHDYPKWIKSAEYNQVTYKELQFTTYKKTSSDFVWPADLRWIMEKTFATSGAPRWIILVDGKVVSNQKSWQSRTYPLIQRLVARKLVG